MSTATEIERLTTARNTIRNKMVDLGLATSTAKIDALATAIDGITNRGSVSATVTEGSTYTIPAGYHNGSGTVSGVSGGGNYTLQSKTVTPTKAQQSVTPDSGYYGLSDVTVGAIPEAYHDVSSVTATAGDVLATKIFVDDEGSVTTGTMPNNGAVSATLDVRTGHTSYTVPAGYHNGSGSVSLVTETKTATPSTSSQSITPTAGKVLSQVTVGAIPSNYKDTTNADAAAADVLSGKKFVNSTGTVTGTMPNNGAVSKTLDATSNNQEYTVPAGYHNGSGKVKITLETKTATPSSASQDITPTSGKVLSKVTVAAIPNTYQDTSAVDATAADVLSGKVFVDSSGEVTGTMTNNGAVSQTLDVRSGNTSYTVPEGYHNGSGTVSIVTETKTATPTTSSQNITPTNGKVLSNVTVEAIPSNYYDLTSSDDNASPMEVLSGYKAHSKYNEYISPLYPSVQRVGQIIGRMPNNGSISQTLDVRSGHRSYSVPYGFTSGGTVSLTIETKTVTPTASAQFITPTDGKVLSQVAVGPIPSQYQDTTNVDAVAANVLAGKVFVDSTGEVTGTMANNGAISGSINGLTTTSYTIPSGYTSGGSVSLTNDIETALAAI